MLYHFDRFSLDSDRRELRRDGAPIAIEPKVFDLMVYLVDSRDRVVSRDDLLAKIWTGRAVARRRRPMPTSPVGAAPLPDARAAETFSFRNVLWTVQFGVAPHTGGLPVEASRTVRVTELAVVFGGVKLLTKLVMLKLPRPLAASYPV